MNNSSRQRYRMAVSYDGTDYSGWQVQPTGTTIQEQLESALSLVLQQPIKVAGSGRTDAGVHAHAQVAHFDSNKPIDPPRLLLKVNNILPGDVRITSLEEAPDDFHARFSACGKEYHYHICLSRVQSPFQRRYQYHHRRNCNLGLFRKAAQRFVGTHDFTSFANEPSQGAVARNPVRTLYRVDVIDDDNGNIRIELEGNGFLYKMARTIVGTIIDVANGKIPLERIDEIFEARDRRRAGRPAPAHGLFLVRVDYQPSTH